MTRTFIASLLALALPVFWACNDIPVDTEPGSEYPYRYERKTISELKDMNQEYHQKNDGKICSTLNEYGLTGFSRVLFPNDVNPCLSKPVVRIELPFSESIVEQARQSVVSNSDYTEVDDLSGLEVAELLALNGCTICEGPDINNVPIEWKISFHAQQVNNIPVEDTEITVYVDALGVNRIWGNWFFVNDPGLPVEGYIEARQNLEGISLSYQTGEGQIIEQEIELDHIEETPEMIFSPVAMDDFLEIRKCWVFTVLNASTGEAQWKVFKDIITGEIVKVEVLETA